MTQSSDLKSSTTHLADFLNQHLEAVWNSVDLDHCLRVLQQVNHFDRWNSFDKFKHTHAFLKTAYAQAGAESECVPIAPNTRNGDGTWILNHSFSIHRAQLHINGELFADYHNNPWHVTHYSPGTPEGGVEGNLVQLDTDKQIETFKHQTLKTRTKTVVLTNRSLMREANVWRELGVVAVISDQPVKDHPDAVTWGKWHWGGPEYSTNGAEPVPSMIISENQGKLIRQRIIDGEAIRACIDIDQETSTPANHDVAMGVISSSATQREIWALAHSAEPGVLDNASGVAVTVECARLLKQYQNSGNLPALQRSIRFINGFECYGFFGYFPMHPETKRPVAGLNVDTVGAKIDKCTGSLRWHETHPTSATWVDTIGEAITTAVMSHAGTAFTFSRLPFLSTEDTLLSDPFFGFPFSWITNHPIKAYHSSGDDMSMVCPESLRMAITISSLHLCYLAHLTEDDLAMWVSDHITDLKSNKSMSVKKQDVQVGATRDNAALWYHESYSIADTIEPSRQGMERIPVRLKIVTPSQENLPDEVIKSYNSIPCSGYNVLFLADGRRSLSDILDLINIEKQVLTQAQLTCFFEGLASIDFLKLI